MYKRQALYGEYVGVRTARKHIAWYVRSLPGGEVFRADMNAIEDCGQQLRAVAGYFDALNVRMDRLPAPDGFNHNKDNPLETTT